MPSNGRRTTALPTLLAMHKGMSHPLRHKLLDVLDPESQTKRKKAALSILNDSWATYGGVSPNVLAKILGEPLTNVSYHVRQLFDLGLIELVETRPRRGALEHYYKAVVRLGALEFERV